VIRDHGMYVAAGAVTGGAANGARAMGEDETDEDDLHSRGGGSVMTPPPCITLRGLDGELSRHPLGGLACGKVSSQGCQGRPRA
jgi:hypothetical protein